MRTTERLHKCEKWSRWCIFRFTAVRSGPDDRSSGSADVQSASCGAYSVLQSRKMAPTAAPPVLQT